MELRAATEDDLPIINEICNHYVRTSPEIYQLEPFTSDARAQWFASHDEQHPILVAVDDGQVVGWGSLSIFHVRAGYRFTVEDSVYVRAGYHGRGIGRALLAELLVRAAANGQRMVIASIDAGNEASIVLHERMGFERVGLLREIGFKFDQWRDVLFLQRRV